MGGFNLSSINTSSYTIFAVEGVSANPGTYYYLGSNAGSTNEGMHLGYSGGEAHLGQFANDLNSPTTYPNTTGTETAREWTMGLDTASGHFIYLNGTQVATNTNTTGFSNLGPSSSNFGILGAGWGGTNAFVGDVGEILIYSSTLTAAQQAGIQAYLIAKWENPVMLPQTTPVVLSSGGTLNLNGVTSTIGSLSSNDPTTQVLLGGAILSTGSNGLSTSFAGSISGSGGLTMLGGMFTLSGSNSYSGPTTLSSGTLQFLGHSPAPASPVVFGGAGTLNFLNDGTGSGGTISVGNSIYFGAAVTSTINVGNLVSSNTGNTVAFGVLSNGTSANAYSSTINFTGSNGYLQSYSGLALPGGRGATTTLIPTTTSVFIAGNVTNQMPVAGSGYDTLALSGTTSDNVIAGAISDASVFTVVGSGDTRLTKSGSSVWTLTGANTFHGPITINSRSGALVVGGAGDLGDLGGSLGGNYSGAISIGASSALVMNTTSKQVLGGVISGAGNFDQDGSGVTSLSGSNTLTGVVTISSGTLQIGAGGSSGSLPAASPIINNSVLAFSRSDSAGVVASTISGTGAVYQIGSGGMALTGSNTYTGSTFVNNGTLFLNGFNSSPAISVAAGAALGGLGSAASASVTVANGGGISPGYSGTGSLTLGSVNFSSSGSINVSNAGNYTSLAALNVLQANGVTANGGSGAITINLTGNAPPVLNEDLRILKYSGALQGAGLSGFSVNASGITNLPARGATFTLTGADAGYIDVYYSADYPIWTGAGDGTWSTALSPSNWKLASSGAPTTFFANDSAVFDDSAGGNTTVNITPANVAPLSAVFKNNTTSYTLQGSNGIVGPAILVMDGSGSLTITNSNGYTGGTTIYAGQVSLNSTSAIGTGPLAVNGGYVLLNSPSAMGAAPLTISGGTVSTNFAQPISSVTLSGGLLDIANSAALGSSSGTITISGGALDNTSGGPLTLPNHAMVWSGNFGFVGSNPLNLGTGAILLAGPSTVNLGANSLTVGGVISGGSNLTQSGAGTLILTAANTFTGNTLVNGGTLLVGNPSALQDSTVSAGGNGEVAFVPTTATFGGLSGGGAIVLTNTAGSAVSLSVGNNNSNSSYSGALSGDGSLNMIGSGALYLSGSNTYSGGTTISAGTLQFQGNNSLPSGNPITFGSATLQIRNDGTGSGGAINLGNNLVISVSNPNYYPANVATIDVGNNRSGNTGNTVAFGLLANYTGYNLFTSTINFTASNGYLQSYTGLDLSDPDPNFGYSSGGTVTLNPTTTSVTIAGPVTNQEQDYYFSLLDLDGTSQGNVISGAISDAPMGQGYTQLTKSNSGAWTLSGLNTFSGPIAVTGGTLVIGGGGDLGDLGGSLGGSYSNTIAIGSGAAFVMNTTNNQTFAGVISGSGSFCQLGSGVTTLTAANTYTGPTSIQAGTLILGAGGSISQTPLISLGNGATFDISALPNYHLTSGQTLIGSGNYTINGAMTADAGSIILPGGVTSSGTMNIGALTLSTGSVLSFDLGSGQDAINVSNSGGLSLSFAGVNLYQCRRHDFFHHAGHIRADELRRQPLGLRQQLDGAQCQSERRLQLQRQRRRSVREHSCAGRLDRRRQSVCRMEQIVQLEHLAGSGERQCNPLRGLDGLEQQQRYCQSEPGRHQLRPLGRGLQSQRQQHPDQRSDQQLQHRHADYRYERRAVGRESSAECVSRQYRRQRSYQ